jgi:hypothetical protein
VTGKQDTPMRWDSMRSALRLGVPCAIVLALAGCIRLEQKLLLNGDGTLAVSYHYSVAADSEALLSSGARVIQGWQGSNPGGGAWFTSEDAVRAHFAAAGVRLQKYRSYMDGGRRHVEMLVFTDTGAKALNAGVFGPLRCDRLPDGRVRLWLELPTVPPKSDGLSADAVAALAQDLYLSLEISVPGEVVRTTAPTRRGSVVRWEFDPAKDTAFLTAPPRLECVFEAKHLDWVASLPAAQ